MQFNTIPDVGSGMTGLLGLGTLGGAVGGMF